MGSGIFKFATVGDTASLIHALTGEPCPCSEANIALSLATWRGHIDTVSALCSWGADVNYQNNGGVTALMFAAKLQRLEIAKELLAFGAKTNIRDNNGRRAVDYALQSGNAEMVNLLDKATE